MSETLIDRIYECAFAPEAWPDVLGQLGQLAGARTGWMFVAGSATPRFVASSPLAEKAILPTLVTGAADASQRAKRLFAAGRHGFLREIDLFTEDELKADPFYQKYIYPLGIGYAAATAITLPTGERLVVSLERQFALGPVESSNIEQLDALRPHLARALLLAARLRLEAARVAGETLAAIGLPGLILDATGRVLAANSLAQALPQAIRFGAKDRLFLADAAAAAKLRAGLGRHRG
jgi:hypothetical protein